MSEYAILDEPESFDDDIESLDDILLQISKEFGLEIHKSINAGFRPKYQIDQDRLMEWKQHLIDLEYLDESEIEGYEYKSSVLLAIEEFRRDSSAILAEKSPNESVSISKEFDTNINAPLDVSDVIDLHHLADYASFDGNTEISIRPLNGDQNLITRILHFRLKALGLYHGQVSDPFNENTQDGLKILEIMLDARPESMETYNLIGDAAEISSKFIAKYGHLPLIVHSPSSDSKNKVDYDKLCIYEGEFKYDEDHWRFLKFTKKQVYNEMIQDIENRGSAESCSLNIQNSFGLQVLQLRLWMMGFYRGRLDGWWGQLSQQALEEALDFAGIDRERVLLYLEDCYWAINLKVIVDELFDQLKKTGASLEQYKKFIAQESIYLKEKSKERRGIFKQIWGAIRETPQKVLSLGRRIYYGISTLFESACSGLMKGYNWISGQFNRIAGPIASLFKAFYKGIGEGVRLAYNSVSRFIHFVLRKPIVTYDKDHGYFVSSQFDFDSDTILIVSQDSPINLIKNHIQICQKLARDLRICLIMAVKVIFFIAKIVSGPPGWLQIGFQLAAIFDIAVHTYT